MALLIALALALGGLALLFAPRPPQKPQTYVIQVPAPVHQGGFNTGCVPWLAFLVGCLLLWILLRNGS